MRFKLRFNLKLILMAGLMTAFFSTGVTPAAFAGPKTPVVKQYKQVPKGAVRIHHGRANYYLHKGHYYKHRNGLYIKVRPPRGIVVTTLPRAAVRVVIGGITYYTCETVYYRGVSGGYEVVEVDERVVQDAQESSPGTAVYRESIAIGSRVKVTANWLNVRSGPGKNHEITGKVRYGAVLKVKGNAPGWIYVRLPTGRYGWVMTRYVELNYSGAKG